MNSRLHHAPTGAPRGIRIPVAALKGRSPRPLDDGGPKSFGWARGIRDLTPSLRSRTERVEYRSVAGDPVQAYLPHHVSTPTETELPRGGRHRVPGYAQTTASVEAGNDVGHGQANAAVVVARDNQGRRPSPDRVQPRPRTDGRVPVRRQPGCRLGSARRPGCPVGTNHGQPLGSRLQCDPLSRATRRGRGPALHHCQRSRANPFGNAPQRCG